MIILTFVLLLSVYLCFFVLSVTAGAYNTHRDTHTHQQSVNLNLNKGESHKLVVVPFPLVCPVWLGF